MTQYADNLKRQLSCIFLPLQTLLLYVIAWVLLLEKTTNLLQVGGMRRALWWQLVQVTDIT
jgi:hypothetical protein